MRNHVLAAALATALAAMPAAAVAYPAVAARDVNLRAGPARDYPVVAVVALGAPLEVLGCLNGYTWCDAIAGPYRARFRWQARRSPTRRTDVRSA